jgi:hypothetical protein
LDQTAAADGTGSKKADIEDIQQEYGFGQCAAFAAALHRRFELPCVEFWAGEPGPDGQMLHAAVVVEGVTSEDDVYVDVFGRNSFEEIASRYADGGALTIRPCECDDLMIDWMGPDAGQVDSDLETILDAGIIVIKQASALRP